jgi:hypothetical protein
VQAAIALCAAAATGCAGEWKDRTRLNCSKAVMVPGMTLAPGSYVFESGGGAASHFVRVFNSDGTVLLETTAAVPTKRSGANDCSVVTFNPRIPAPPIALKAWFSPGSLYGHEFVYPDYQARSIARRTNRNVLSVDDAHDGTSQRAFRLIEPSGREREWHADPELSMEWEAWRRTGATGASVTHVAGPHRNEPAALVTCVSESPMPVTVDALEKYPDTGHHRGVGVADVMSHGRSHEDSRRREP